MMLALNWYAGLVYASATDPGIDLLQIVLNNSVAVAIIGLMLYTTRLRTGLNYDDLKEQMAARLAEKDEMMRVRLAEKDDVINKQNDMIRRFQEAGVVSAAAMAKSADVLELLPDKETTALDEVRAMLSRLESLLPPEAQ